MTDLACYYPRIYVSVEPTTEPVDLASVQNFIQYEGTDSASLETIISLMTAARRKVEHDAAVALITQTRVMRLDRFYDELDIRLAPVSAVVITYLDDDGDSQTLSADIYDLDIYSRPARIRLESGETWPTTYGEINDVTVTITCGYGAASAVPDEAKLAVKLLVKDWFWGRCATGEVSDTASMLYGSLIEQLSWRSHVL